MMPLLLLLLLLMLRYLITVHSKPLNNKRT
jgi:hypothetical protein